MVQATKDSRRPMFLNKATIDPATLDVVLVLDKSLARIMGRERCTWCERSYSCTCYPYWNLSRQVSTLSVCDFRLVTTSNSPPEESTLGTDIPRYRFMGTSLLCL